MDMHFNLKSFSSESIHACVAACGLVDALYKNTSGVSGVNPKILEQNAGQSKTLNPDSRDAMIARGTLEWLQDFHKNPQSFSLSNTSVRTLHRKILKYSSRDDGTRGNYRTNLDAVMKSFFEETKNELIRHDRHPLFVISIFRALFIDLMPFITGNVLCANYLAYGLLFNNNYPIVSQLPLIASLNNPDSPVSYDPLVVLPKALSILLNDPDQNLSIHPSLLNPKLYLNPRRKSLLNYISKNAPLKISDIMLFFPNESRNTIKKDLLFLKNKELVFAKGNGRGVIYFIKHD